MNLLLQDQTSRERVIQSLASMSSSQIVSATALHHKSLKPISSSAAAAPGANNRPTADTLRHASYHSHNGYSANTVSLSTRFTFFCGSGTDTHSHILFFLFLLGNALQKSLRFRRFKFDRDEIWHNCSPSINTHR